MRNNVRNEFGKVKQSVQTIHFKMTMKVRDNNEMNPVDKLQSLFTSQLLPAFLPLRNFRMKNNFSFLILFLTKRSFFLWSIFDGSIFW